MSDRRHLTRFKTTARRDLTKLPQKEALRILRRLAEFQQAMDDGTTDAFDIKALQGPPGHWRLRIGDYRTVYTLEPDEDGNLVIWLWVVAVGDRKEIYRRF
ncbi:type II toxin-antitoxin system RelE family toxin [Nocardiopsis valliformis]|uniref:type II toxin-antitoxin system RelE family toxin n=1 Tax=Nocardiopsis valliformis TaxID=239974 RepID=UPI00034886F8|nr:type II toxin-antitoxin system RelE/ParE family toxin [Nocardiopsis valliformis]